MADLAEPDGPAAGPPPGTGPPGADEGRLRLIRLAILAGALIAALGAVGIAASDDPDRLADGIDPFVWVLGGGLLLALVATYPLLHMRAGRCSKPDGVFSVWDRAIFTWGVLAAVLGGLFALLGIPSEFAGSDALGAISIVGMVVCGIAVALVIAVVVG